MSGLGTRSSMNGKPRGKCKTRILEADECRRTPTTALLAWPQLPWAKCISVEKRRKKVHPRHCLVSGNSAR